MHVVRPGLNRLPILAALAAGAAMGLACLALPADWLEGAVEASGLAAVLPVAAPPLGATARGVLALGGGAAVALVVWAAAYLLVGPGGPLAPRQMPQGDAPIVRRADAHPDAPPRRPFCAADLPAPPPPAVKPVPADLDQPLAAFDPHAVLPVPREPVRALKPLAPVPAPPLAPGERLETYVLTPPPPPAPPPEASEPPSIDALLRRLEQGAQKREGRLAASR